MRALIIIDVQNDFCPGGALAVNNGDEIIAPINALQADYQDIVLTQDWHPQDHMSFASNQKKEPFSVVDADHGPQVLWPDHCVIDSNGAAFHSALDTSRANMILRKGYNRAIDSYSAFFENDHKTPTGLAGYLQSKNIEALDFVGLATDFCVAWSAIDGANLGFETRIILPLTRAIDLDDSFESAIAEMKAAGVQIGEAI